MFGKERNFATLAKFSKYLGNFWRVNFIIGKIFNLLWQIVDAIGHIFIVTKGPNISEVIY